MMKSYTAYCMNEDGENMCMTREYNGKKDFMSDLHGNGYKVHFIALTDNYDEECAKYYERLEQKRRISAIRRECEREWKRRDAEFEKAVAEAVAEEEPTTEEPAQEAETMRFKKDYFNFITKKIEKYNCIRFDSDIEFYVTNCTEKQEPAAIRKAVEKFIEELKKNENTDILVDSLEMMYNCNEFDQRSTFNEIKNGGNAYEIEVNRYNDKTLSIYIRICEHGDDITQEEIDRVFEEEIIKEFENEQAEKLEETKPEETENQEEEKPAENPTDSAFITEMFAALEYFKRVLWNYTEAMIKAQEKALEEARAKDRAAAEEARAAEAEEQTTAENFAPSFDIIKPHLFAKAEHITADFPNRSEVVYRKQGDDIALSIWIDAAFTNERLSRQYLDAWEAAGIVEERHIFEIAMENTMAQQKPRIHAGTMFYNPDADSLSNSALLESCFNRQNLDKHSDILVTTSEQNNGAIALFYPPVCEKICELLHGAGFYVAFTSKNEGIVHKLDHLEVSAIRHNLQSTNRIFDPADTLTDEVFYYDPIIKRLIPESKTADFEVLRRQVLKGLA